MICWASIADEGDEAVDAAERARTRRTLLVSRTSTRAATLTSATSACPCRSAPQHGRITCLRRHPATTGCDCRWIVPSSLIAVWPTRPTISVRRSRVKDLVGAASVVCPCIAVIGLVPDSV